MNLSNFFPGTASKFFLKLLVTVPVAPIIIIIIIIIIRPAGRPTSRWEDDVRNDLRKTKLIKWAEQVQDRLKWKVIVEKARTLSEL